MKLGYNWKFGPFELIDQLGAEGFAQRLAADGMSIPPLLEKARKHGFYQYDAGETHYLQPDGTYIPLQRPSGVLLLADLKRHAKPLLENDAASLWDIGDGVACLEFHSKMNALDPLILEMIGETVEFIPATTRHWSSITKAATSPQAQTLVCWCSLPNSVAGMKLTRW